MLQIATSGQADCHLAYQERALQVEGRLIDGGCMTTTALAAEFAALFRSQPVVIERLLAEHVDDGTGRCQICSSGPQAARKIWPCALYEYASHAIRQNGPSGEGALGSGRQQRNSRDCHAWQRRAADPADSRHARRGAAGDARVAARSRASAVGEHKGGPACARRAGAAQPAVFANRGHQPTSMG